MGLFDRLFGRRKEEAAEEPAIEEVVQEALDNLDFPEKSEAESSAAEQEQAENQPEEAAPRAEQDDSQADFYQDLNERLAEDQVLNQVIEDKVRHLEETTSDQEADAEGSAPAESDLDAAEGQIFDAQEQADTEEVQQPSRETAEEHPSAEQEEVSLTQDTAVQVEQPTEAEETVSDPQDQAPVKDYYQELQDRLAEARKQVSQEQDQEEAATLSPDSAQEARQPADDGAEQEETQSAPESEQEETVQEKYDRSLKKTRTGFGARLNAFFANFRSVDEEFFEELEELLITSDVGVQVASHLTEELRYEARLENAKKPDALRQLIIEKLVDIYEKDGQFHEKINLQSGLTVMLFVGVNGVGKTTSIGKLAYKYKQAGKKVMLVAADTFRAGAVAQLAEWGRRVDVPVVTGPEKSDPASVVFDGMERAQAEQVDILMIDTAGRLQNKDNLMAELEKIGRIIKRVDPNAPHETFLALDASTGQNALVQAKEFSKITPVTGIVLTKIDGTARGGVVLAIRQELDIPVKLIGFGEKIDDIGEFNSENFMRGLLEGLI